MPSRAARALPWIALLNALLMFAIAQRYAAVKGAWLGYRVAAEARSLAGGEGP